MKEGLMFNVGFLFWKLYHKIRFSILKHYFSWKRRERVVYVVVEYSNRFAGKIWGVFDSEKKADNFRFGLNKPMGTVQVCSHIINKGEE